MSRAKAKTNRKVPVRRANRPARRRGPAFGLPEALSLVAVAIILIALVLYAAVTVKDPPDYMLSLCMGAFTLFLFIVLGVRFLPCWAKAWSGAPDLPMDDIGGLRTNRREALHPIGSILLWLALWRIAIFIGAYALDVKLNGYTGPFFERLDLWSPAAFDAKHYLSIAENWYAASGDSRFLLVFLPFFPLLTRLCAGFLPDYLTAGLFVSNLCAVLSGAALYELALLDTDRITAKRSVRYLCLLPAAFLFSAPLSDSLFLLLSILCVLLIRKKRYLPACLFGGLAAFTRLLGLTLLAPAAFELIGETVRAFKSGKSKAKALSDLFRRAFCLLLIPLGFGVYLLINKRISGEWFRFLTYQRENWQQSPGWFFTTHSTQWDYLIDAVKAKDMPYVLGLWLPNILSTALSLAVMIPAADKLRPSYTAYFIGYFAVGMGATWLLSAPRYMAALFPLPLALATLTKNRWTDLLVSLCCLGGLILYLYAFTMGWYVY